LNTRLRPRALLCALIAAIAMPAVAADRFDVAITVDDLPVHGPLPRGLAWGGIAQSYIDTLKHHGVTEAYGFINARGLEDQPASGDALARWRQAGYPLGNHTWSHMGLSQAPSLQTWLDEVAKNEPVLAARMGRDDWRWLRYPFLDAGGTPERHDAALAWLTSHGYRVADVSISFDDWAYTDTYARCLDKGDTAAIEDMKAAYLRRVDEQIARTKALSQRVYGRMVPQVLLTHLGAWSAATLPQVLDRLDAAGARYVPLAQAQSDAVYRATGPAAGNNILLERRARELAVDTGGLPVVTPVGKLDGVCR
jgi:peptidoglycan/xylan/chitin deacetylase (PgdA/CDA1 family)